MMMFSPDTYDGFGQSDSESLESDRYEKFEDKIELRVPIKYDLIQYTQEETIIQEENSFFNQPITNLD